ncbi:MAG: hypothetical protein KAT25_06555 [Sulfuriflexus sp.]|nr:hypothetical protein [Sulfuriflexus sp.]
MDKEQKIQKTVTNYYSADKWTIKHWSALILFISAFACAAYFENTDSDIIKKYVGTYFGLSIALSLVFWGLIDLERGYVKGRINRYYRKDNPKMFGFLFLFKILLPAIGMLFVGFVFAFK